MKPWQLNRKLDDLSEKLKDASMDGTTRIDPDCLTEGEKLLFAKVSEFYAKYGLDFPDDVLAANWELFSKALDVIFRRVLDLFLFVMPKAFGSGEIEEWYFKLHFYNFYVDLLECLERVSKWPEKEREIFLNDMKQNDGLNKVFRIPRGPNVKLLRKRKKRQEG